MPKRQGTVYELLSGDRRRSYSLSQNICGALLNIMKTTNYIAMAPLQYFFIKKWR